MVARAGVRNATPCTRVMYGIRQCNRKKNSGEIGAFFTEIFFLISVVILN